MSNDESDEGEPGIKSFRHLSFDIKNAEFASPPDALPQARDAFTDHIGDAAAFGGELRVGFVSGLLVQLLQHLAAEFTIAQRPAALHDVAANEFIIVAEPVAAREVRANFAGGKIEEFGVARDF